MTWIEHFGAKSSASKRAAAIAFRASLPSKKLPASGLFASAQVGAVLAAGHSFQNELRVVHDPVIGNSGHAEIRHFDDSDLELLDHMASSVFDEIDFVSTLRLPKV
ncbi:MAG TPA: hypothetical protein VI168_00270 [Croceibacterium sp.]